MQFKAKLRPVRTEDEAQLVAGHQAMAAEDLDFNFDFALDLDLNKPFADYVDLLTDMRYGINLPEGYVPATFLLAVVDETIVGRVAIRHRLNDFLSHQAGHIGYGVLAEHRRKGYATDMLSQALIIARSLGIDTAMLTCEENNVGSARVIERCGGVLRDHVTAASGATLRRYDIDLYDKKLRTS